MGLVTFALIIAAAVWIGVLVFVLAVCRASAHADANEERCLAEGRDDVSTPSLAPHSNATIGGEQRPADRAELEREAQRLGLELPKRPHVRLTLPAGIRRHRS